MGQVLVDRFGFTRRGFADAVRRVLYELNPYVAIDGWDERFRVQSVVDEHGWEYAKANTEIRQLLQRLGTEAGRGVLGEDIWVRTAMTNLKYEESYVFTDVRFPNEADAIIHQGGRLWKMERSGTAAINGHPSETALDDYCWPTNTVTFTFRDTPIDELRKNMINLAGNYVG